MSICAVMCGHECVTGGFLSVIFFFLDVTLKSILCQSETPVIKKLLHIALTVRLFVGNKVNCSPHLPTSMKDPAFLFFGFFCHFEGLRHIHSVTSWKD